MKNRFLSKIILAFLTISLTINSCKKDDKAEGIDKELLDMARSTNGFVWYKKSSALLNKSSGTGHSFPYLRTRYNSTAATKLDSNGIILPGVTFPEGSLIVKELYSNSSTLSRYAILYKKSGRAETDAKGWIWGYVNADGTVASPASEKGNSCINCHSQTGSIDYMLMNKYFP